MRIRLQAVIDESELREIEVSARRRGVTVSEWVRDALRAALTAQTRPNRGQKLDAIRAAARHALPTGDIQDMLAESHGERQRDA